MDVKPTVDVIIPCHNVERAIDRCIQSLIAQNYPSDKYHCYFINDASTDQTAHILNSYNGHSEITIINHDVNKGLSATRNTGFNAGKSDFVCFLDGDMEVKHDWLDSITVPFLNSNITAVMGDNTSPPDADQNEFEKYYFSQIRGARQFSDGSIIPAKYLLFGNVAVRRTTLLEVGLFDETFKYYGGEDTDLAFRINDKYPNSFVISNKSTSIHYHPRTLESFLSSMHLYGKSNLPVLLKKHPNHEKELAGHLIHSITGFLIFNPIVRNLLKVFNPIYSSNWLTRYKVADAVITGARAYFRKKR